MERGKPKEAAVATAAKLKRFCDAVRTLIRPELAGRPSPSQKLDTLAHLAGCIDFDRLPKKEKRP